MAHWLGCPHKGQMQESTWADKGLGMPESVAKRTRHNLKNHMYEFPPTPEAAQERLDLVNPRDYAHTRNALDGAVTHLSPYLTHGFLSVPDVANVMYHQHRLGVQHKFIYELGWREYYQHLHHQSLTRLIYFDVLTPVQFLLARIHDQLQGRFFRQPLEDLS